MYYDTYRGKKHRHERRKRSSCMGWLLGKLCKLALTLLLLAAIAAGALYALPVSLMNVEPRSGADLSLTDGLPGNQVNILLLGLDFLHENQQRSDAIMIASVGYDGVKLTSVMRDIMVDIPGYGQHKLNAAFSYGGAEMVMRIINETFHLNITNYIAVDMRTLVDVVDAVGGVEIGIEENEIEYLNHYAWDTFNKIMTADSEKYQHYWSSQPVTAAGNMELNGLFATAYTRIRYADSDFMRTARQREVLSATLKKLRENFYNPRIYIDLLDVARNSIQTNISLPELISLGEKILISGKVETNRVPRNEHMQDNYSSIEIIKPQENVQSLHEFIYN